MNLLDGWLRSRQKLESTLASSLTFRVTELNWRRLRWVCVDCGYALMLHVLIKLSIYLSIGSDEGKDNDWISQTRMIVVFLIIRWRWYVVIWIWLLIISARMILELFEMAIFGKDRRILGIFMGPVVAAVVLDIYQAYFCLTLIKNAENTVLRKREGRFLT